MPLFTVCPYCKGSVCNPEMKLKRDSSLAGSPYSYLIRVKCTAESPHMAQTRLTSKEQSKIIAAAPPKSPSRHVTKCCTEMDTIHYFIVLVG